MQSEQSSQSPEMVKPQIEPISIGIIIAWTQFGNWVFDKLLGWLLGGPAGSGGKFREAAENARVELNNLWAKIKSPLYQIVYTPSEWSKLPDIFQAWLTNLALVYKAQDDAWEKFKGRNLLGATFFGGWTNSMIMKDHIFPMHYIAQKVNTFRDDVAEAQIKDLRRRLEELDIPPNLAEQLFDLKTRIDKLDELLSPEIANLVKTLPTLYDYFDKLLKEFIRVREGTLGKTDPATRQLVTSLLATIAEFTNEVLNLPPNYTHQDLLTEIGRIRQLSDHLGRWLQGVRDQLQDYPLPRMQQDLNRLKEQVKEIPKIQANIKRLQDQIDDITKQELPKLRQQINDRLKPIQERVQDHEQRLRRIEALQPLLWLPRLIDFLKDWPDIRERIIIDACKRCIPDPPDPDPPDLKCVDILRVLCKCKDSQNPILKDLWKCVFEDDKPEPPKLVKTPLIPTFKLRAPRITVK